MCAIPHNRQDGVRVFEAWGVTLSKGRFEDLDITPKSNLVFAGQCY